MQEFTCPFHGPGYYPCEDCLDARVDGERDDEIVATSLPAGGVQTDGKGVIRKTVRADPGMVDGFVKASQKRG